MGDITLRRLINPSLNAAATHSPLLQPHCAPDDLQGLPTRLGHALPWHRTHHSSRPRMPSCHPRSSPQYLHLPWPTHCRRRLTLRPGHHTTTTSLGRSLPRAAQALSRRTHHPDSQAPAPNRCPMHGPPAEQCPLAPSCSSCPLQLSARLRASRALSLQHLRNPPAL